MNYHRIMMRPLSSLVFLFLCSACVQVIAEKKTFSFEQDQLEALEKGEVIFLEPEGQNMLAAVVRIEAKPEFVWEIMLDHERVPNYVKELRESKLLETGENWKVVQHKLKMSPLLPRFEYVFKEQYGPDYTIEFNRISGAFRELSGQWKLVSEQDDDHALLLYTTYVDFGWYIPKSWVKKGISKRVPNLLNAFRDEVYREKGIREKEKENS